MSDPLPWVRDCTTIVENDGNSEDVIELRDADGVTVAYVHDVDDTVLTILEAVNGRPNLVAAMHQALSIATLDTNDPGQAFARIRNVLRAALPDA